MNHVPVMERMPNIMYRIKNGNTRIHNLMGNISNIKCGVRFKGPFRHIQRDMIEFSFYYNNEMSFCFLFRPVNAVNV